ncbi:unnamed protein product, partial [Mycena citricolor]
ELLSPSDILRPGPPEKLSFLRRIGDGAHFVVKCSGTSDFPREGHLVHRLLSKPPRSDRRNKMPSVEVRDIRPNVWLMISPLNATFDSPGSQTLPIPNLVSTEDFFGFDEQCRQASYSQTIAHFDLSVLCIIMQHPTTQPRRRHRMDLESPVSFNIDNPSAARPPIDETQGTAYNELASDSIPLPLMWGMIMLGVSEVHFLIRLRDRLVGVHRDCICLCWEHWHEP